ncbi:MAG TPA: GNAT family protein [Noviherbaspirillum sp.]|jgi:RimJ/RimL family protein N-acetyltransferase|uniref:GNAT family N-acetyltransferase n=1 Tax=Noviherbaspirillum sp. TaxID=1926288 RepID=UPI002F95F5F8
MNYRVDSYLLALPEEQDLEMLYEQKNDPEVARLLGGFSFGYTRAGLNEWLQQHSGRKDEVLFAIRDYEKNRCIGHLGLYRIDYRTRSCEYGIMIGDKDYWGIGAGRAVTAFALRYAFDELNMNRVELSLLATNERAKALYLAHGFRQEGVLRQACFKDGDYVDVLVMSLLRREYGGRNDQ